MEQNTKSPLEQAKKALTELNAYLYGLQHGGDAISLETTSTIRHYADTIAASVVALGQQAVASLKQEAVQSPETSVPDVGSHSGNVPSQTCWHLHLDILVLHKSETDRLLGDAPVSCESQGLQA